MLSWTEDRTPRPYTPPDDSPVDLGPPRSSWSSTAADGALLEAFRWGSPLGGGFVLEVRRHGAPRPLASPPEDEHEPPELPRIGELQSAADELLPPGTVMLLGVLANGPGATYPSASSWRALRIVQATQNVGSSRRRPEQIIGGGRPT